MLRELLVSHVLRINQSARIYHLWQFFPDVVAEADNEVVTAVGLRHELAFEIEDREGVHPWLAVAYSKLAVLVRAPAPRQALLIDCDTKISSQAHINDTILDDVSLLGEGHVALRAAAPRVELSLVSDAS